MRMVIYMETNKDLKLTIYIGRGWKYLTNTQSVVLDKIISVMQTAKTRDKKLCTSHLVKLVGINYNTLSRVLGYLVSARILRAEQYGRVVLYSFTKNWKTQLKKVTKKRGVESGF